MVPGLHLVATMCSALNGPGAGMNFAAEFEKVLLLTDLIPFIEANYRVIADPSQRAMAGLSMGGMQTRSILIANPDKFAYAGLFSSLRALLFRQKSPT